MSPGRVPPWRQFGFTSRAAARRANPPGYRSAEYLYRLGENPPPRGRRQLLRGHGRIINVAPTEGLVYVARRNGRPLDLSDLRALLRRIPNRTGVLRVFAVWDESDENTRRSGSPKRYSLARPEELDEKEDKLDELPEDVEPSWLSYHTSKRDLGRDLKRFDSLEAIIEDGLGLKPLRIYALEWESHVV